jgi:hypothetical protein
MTLKVTRAEFLGIDRMDEDELRDNVLDLLEENAKLRDLLGRGAARPIVVADDGTDGATGSCRCGACGEPIDPWDRWCRHCGTEVER